MAKWAQAKRKKKKGGRYPALLHFIRLLNGNLPRVDLIILNFMRLPCPQSETQSEATSLNLLRNLARTISVWPSDTPASSRPSHVASRAAYATLRARPRE